MTHCTKITLVVVVILLFCSPCFASKIKLHIFDSNYFTINLPVGISQSNSKKVPHIDDNGTLTYTFRESNKTWMKSILLIVIVGKIESPVPNDPVKEMAKTLQATAGDDLECQGITTGLAETRISGQKAYYFERRSENCVVTLERYWATINGKHAITIYLARPGKSDDAVARSVINGIVTIKLKQPHLPISLQATSPRP